MTLKFVNELTAGGQYPSHHCQPWPCSHRLADLATSQNCHRCSQSPLTNRNIRIRFRQHSIPTGNLTAGKKSLLQNHVKLRGGQSGFSAFAKTASILARRLGVTQPIPRHAMHGNSRGGLRGFPVKLMIQTAVRIPAPLHCGQMTGIRLPRAVLRSQPAGLSSKTPLAVFSSAVSAVIDRAKKPWQRCQPCDRCDRSKPCQFWYGPETPTDGTVLNRLQLAPGWF